MSCHHSLVLILITIFSWAGCRHAPEPARSTAAEYPSEWMYLQRAGADGIIDPLSVRQAIDQVKIAVQRRRSEEAAWQLAGPVNTGGRVTDIQLDPEHENVIYVGTSNGGVFKSVDQGLSWFPVFEEVGRMSIGNLAIAPSDPATIYVGTGEANGSATSGAFFGDGIYKSVNGGNTWQHAGLGNSQHIGRIMVDPNDPNRVFVAAAGLLYGKSQERGVYRTLDGGVNWERVHFVSDSTACIDVVMNPQDPDILFAAMWERRRFPHRRVYGGVTSGI
ncbi:MAG: hypothetical protein R3330_18015, partial [Saprospiraceae bacterium]|nr:hypothetical protein [Saprospiraceae bacterium]